MVTSEMLTFVQGNTKQPWTIMNLSLTLLKSQVTGQQKEAHMADWGVVKWGLETITKL